MRSSDNRHEFDAEQIADLLNDLHLRLRSRQVAAAVFVVGGAAIAAIGIRQGRLTADIDAISGDDAVVAAAAAADLARERGLPADWLNPRARMWMPSLPAGVLDAPEGPGLRITFADASYLLATKLEAQRAKDAEDVIALAEEVGMPAATAAELEAHVRRYCSDADLEFVLGGDDPSAELRLMARDASRLLARRR